MALWPQTVVKVVVSDPEPQAEERGDDAVSPAPFGLEELDFEKALADPQRFGQALTANLQRALFLLLPVFALLLELLYLRRRILYLDHLVFALHFHAFAFVVLTAMVLMEAAGIPRGVLTPVGVAAWLWIFVYLFLALRRVYGGSRLAAGLRLAALLTSYGIVFVLALLVLMLLTIYRLQS